MLVDKLKEVQLVAESKVLQIDADKRLFSRFDKTVYIEEPIASRIVVAGSGKAYVEASKFFGIYSALKKIELTENYVLVVLENGAEYKLPLVLLSWEDRVVQLPPTPTVTIKLASGRLSSATLKNLANPMLQCIYVDETTAVSCDSMVACIDGSVTSPKLPLLLPPDIISLVEGNESKLYVEDKNYILSVGEAIVIVPIPQLDYTETANLLRGSLPEGIDRFPTVGLLDSLTRLRVFGDYVSFQTDKVVCEEDYEPFNFPTANLKYKYDINSLISVVGQGTHIAQSDYALLIYGDKFLFMVSPEPLEEGVE